MEIVIIIILILLNGLLSMTEIALVSAKKYRLESAAKKGSKAAGLALQLAGNPNRFLSTVQIGITLIGILVGVFSSDSIQAALAEKLGGIPALAPYAETLAMILIVAAVTFLSIVLGELFPKRLGLLFPEKMAIVMAWPMLVLSKITAPFVWLLGITNNMLLFLFGIRRSNAEQVTEEEIKAIVEQSVEMGEVAEIEHRIVDRVFALGDRRISELMTHRSHVEWLNVNDDTTALRRKVNKDTHSIYPVCDGNLDNLLGVVSLKELYTAGDNISGSALHKYLKKALIIHENIAAYAVLEMYRAAKTHFAVIVDEYGSITGIATMDDILDALVGDVSENMQEQYHIKPMQDGTWLADGQYPFFELLHYFHIPEEGEGREFNTIGGLILEELGHIPQEGDSIEWEGYEIKVVDKDGMRIDKVIIRKLEKEEE